MMKTLESFKTYIKTLSDSDLLEYGAEIEKKISRCRDPQIKLGYSMGLEEIYMETCMRKYPVSEETLEMSDEELLQHIFA